MIFAVSGQIEIEEWDRPYWRPSLLPLYRVRGAPLAPSDLLQALGVPENDWRGSAETTWETPLLIRITKTMDEMRNLEQHAPVARPENGELS